MLSVFSLGQTLHLGLAALLVVGCNTPLTEVKVKTSAAITATNCEKFAKCIKDPEGLASYNPQLVTKDYVLRRVSETSPLALIHRIFNLQDQTSFLLLDEKLSAVVKGISIIDNANECPNPDDVAGANPTFDNLLLLEEGSYKVCLAYMGDGYVTRIHSLKSFHVDLTKPTVTLSSTLDPGPTTITSVPLTIQFSEPVTNFDEDSIAVSGATKGNLVTIDDRTFTLELSASQGIITASLNEGAAADAAGNTLQASNTWSLTINGVASAPTASVTPGIYTATQLVTLSSTTPGAAIYFTTNGDTPSPQSTVYSTAISVSATQTIKAFATASNYNNSSISTFAYIITGQVAAPTFSLADGFYTDAQSLTLSTTTSGATIYYTTNGSSPTTESSVYSSPISISRNTTVKAIATKANYVNSNVATATYMVVIRLTDALTAEGSVYELANGNIVVANSNADYNGVSGAGIVQLFNRSTGALISTLYGTTASDGVGEQIYSLANGNFVVQSKLWDNGTTANVGAVTWCSGTSGCSGAVSTSNSLIGSAANDQVGVGVTTLTNGNYVIRSPNWDWSGITNAGAVTWCSGTSGCSGTLSVSNSLVGSSANDQVGAGVTGLTNGNYVIRSPLWNNGAIVDSGAVTFCTGTSGCVGTISASNSLIGADSDSVGVYVTPLPNGHYVVRSPIWNSSNAFGAGAVTWCSGITGCTGLVSASNSLVGSSDEDQLGMGVASLLALDNGNYVVSSIYWDNGTNTDAGAVTWCDGTTGCVGPISPSNSLVGSNTGDQVGTRLTALSNNYYVVSSISWRNGTTLSAGAVTWCSGTSGCSGTISAANSLVGSSENDSIGTSVSALTNGNYVVRSRYWDYGSVTDAGAVSWCSGSTGCTGPITSTNSLIGSTNADQLGTTITALSNGNYVVSSVTWDLGTTPDVGAVTWCSGSSGCSGQISASNSLIGSTTNDQIGSQILDLINGNYVVRSINWDNNTIVNAGAVTWCSGVSGCSGVISEINSLVGSTANDGVGSPVKLATGHYAVASVNWDSGTSTDVGAITWCSGTTGCSGIISSSNSLVGTLVGDKLGGSGTLSSLSNGDFIARSPNYGNPDQAHIIIFSGDSITRGSL